MTRKEREAVIQMYKHLIGTLVLSGDNLQENRASEVLKTLYLEQIKEHEGLL